METRPDLLFIFAFEGDYPSASDLGEMSFATMKHKFNATLFCATYADMRGT